MQDKELTCICGKTFTFTVGEQKFFKKNEYAEPKRCKECRAKKKAERREKYVFSYNNPPMYGQLTLKQWGQLVDEESFPRCSNCHNRIYNPDFYDSDLCGPCSTGEADTIMAHSEEFDNIRSVNGIKV